MPAKADITSAHENASSLRDVPLALAVAPGSMMVRGRVKNAGKAYLPKSALPRNADVRL